MLHTYVTNNASRRLAAKATTYEVYHNSIKFLSLQIRDRSEFVFVYKVLSAEPVNLWEITD